MALTAVVLAGGPPDSVSALESGAVNKAFVHVGGVTLVERTLRALRDARDVTRIVAVAPVSMHGSPALALADEQRADGARIAQSLRSGVAGFDPNVPLLIAAADLPVLRADAVDDFIARALLRDADATYGIVERRTHAALYPCVRHTWARMREGTYCGAGLFTLKSRIYPALERFLDDLGRARKAPLRLASIFGWDVLLNFAVHRLRIADAERRASALLHAPVAAVESPYPQIAVNVDRPSDFALAARLVST